MDALLPMAHDAPTVVALLVTMRLLASRLDAINYRLGLLVSTQHPHIRTPPPEELR